MLGKSDGLQDYNLRFGETFYDTSRNARYNHVQTLVRIDCPSVFIHTNWSYDENGVLLAAMSGEDAARVPDLIAGNGLVDVDSGHDVHFEKPVVFVQAMVDFLDEVE